MGPRGISSAMGRREPGAIKPHITYEKRAGGGRAGGSSTDVTDTLQRDPHFHDGCYTEPFK